MSIKSKSSFRQKQNQLWEILIKKLYLYAREKFLDDLISTGFEVYLEDFN